LTALKQTCGCGPWRTPGESQRRYIRRLRGARLTL
jgi:hypothetical protein